MITFKQHLIEARMAPLYHGTTLTNLRNILQFGIVSSTTHIYSALMQSKFRGNATYKEPGRDIEKFPDFYQGVSLTRDKQFALSWSGTKGSSGISLAIQLDQQALASRYKIIPINYWSKTINAARMSSSKSRYNEFEEFVIFDKTIPPKYITAVWYIAYHPAAKDAIDDLKTQYPNIAFRNAT